ncbi:MAG: acyl--CoA ligase, partial [Firmicutes bacterium]|nr:acyl--CoA ligase [Bacillota bacterium]
MAELIHRLLERNARKYSSDVAVRYPAGDITWTWQELNARANALAHYLVDQGLRAGDRIAVLVPNRPEFLQVCFAALKAGAVVVPVNVKLTAGEIGYILQDSGASVLVFDGALAGTAEAAAAGAGVTLLLNTSELEATTSGWPQTEPDLEGTLDDQAELLYTSGTTGRPKGVQLTHNAVHSVASMMAYEIDIRWRDRVLILMPLTHSAPLNLMMTGAVYAGAACVLGDFTPQA